MESNHNINSRIKSPELDIILGKEFKVLDDGFIRVVDYMGNDSSIVQAARVSFGEGTKKINEDIGLIRYLMRNKHTTPFEMCEIKLHIRVPMDCWRQWVRHRTASINEYSTRYSIAIDSILKTESNNWRLQSLSNKQGSDNRLSDDIGLILTKKEEALHRFIKEVYDERLTNNVAREQARKDLSLSTYTEAYWKINLHNLLNFLRLRLDNHAQFEIRCYAETIANEIVSKWCPITWQSFQDYTINSINLTAVEIELLKLFNIKKFDKICEILKAHFMVVKNDGMLKRNREYSEFELKLENIGLIEQWNSQIQL